MTRFGILILLAAFFAGCKTAKLPINNMKEFDFEGHRGCRGLMPENTIPAMLKAIDLNVTTLEMDASVTQDKKVILSHEPFFNSEITTKPNLEFVKPREEKELNIYKMDYEKVARYDVGSRGNSRFPEQQKMKVAKPLLNDVIAAVKQYCAEKNKELPFFNIETKSQPPSDNMYHPAPKEFVELIIAVIKEAGLEDKTIIQSFDFRTLQYLHEKYPNIKTAILVEAEDRRSFRKQLDDLGFMPTIYSPEKSLVNENLIKEAREKNIKVIPWTVNNKRQMQKLINLGVDGLISDYPNLYSELKLKH